MTAAAHGEAPAPLPEAVPVGGLPRRPVAIDPVNYAELPPELQNEFEPRVRRLGYLGAFFAFGGRQPRALGAFQQMTEELKTVLPDDVIEVVALAVATALDCKYERAQHERLAARQGHSAAWIEAAAGGSDGDVLSPAQVAVRALSLKMIAGRGAECDAELRAVVDHLGQDAAVGVLLLAGRYIAHSHIANVLGLTNPVA